MVRETRVASRLIEAQPRGSNSGHSWTLASQLGNMLQIAESVFGGRDETYTILGIEFVDGSPKIWYPGDSTRIVIQLCRTCLLKPDFACFELAHETVHLLSPVRGQSATVLEEGLATHFQVWYMDDHYPQDWPRLGLDTAMLPQSYAHAKSLVEQVLHTDPDAIRQLRIMQPVLSRITAQQIQCQCPSLPPGVATALAGTFEEIHSL